MEKAWKVYIVQCADGTFYTGITTDVERRVDEHNFSDSLAAKYTQSRRPVILVYEETLASRADAAKREYQIRCMGRLGKEALIAGCCPGGTVGFSVKASPE